MTVIISTKNSQKHLKKDFIKIGSDINSDVCLKLGAEFALTLEYNKERGGFILSNKSSAGLFTVQGKPLPAKCLIKTGCLINVSGTSETIEIKIAEDEEEILEISEIPYHEESIQKHTAETPLSHAAERGGNIKTEQDVETYMQDKSKLEHSQSQIENARTAVIKEVGFVINDLKKRLHVNSMGSIILHIAMLFSSLVCAFGVSNFLTGLKIEQTQNFINLPVNIKIMLLFTAIIYGLGLIIKQGVFLWYENKVRATAVGKSSQSAMLIASAISFGAVYIINLLYYVNLNPIFGILISLFFVGLTVVLAAANGYFKYSLHAMSYELDKYEYREDFEAIITDYRFWIKQYINSLSSGKIESIKDKLFNMQIKSVGEIILGILTAPFLAYGVSNTLASCFPEAAGWIRISGLRFSPIFLVLASFMIIFAFFSFVNAFLSVRKVQASNVIKQDGFSNPFSHGVDIFGIQEVQRLETEKKRCLMIGLAIVFIEFTMNTSYFFTEIGGDLQGILLSLIAALVPTALLIAETYMLSQTKYDIYAYNELLDKREI